ncbi:hypothetical protein DWQ67_13440 [Galactobacter caseinivorans]|uniref:Uncharacterized protein n=2 Tax=Galactobacter caseinivorans TaxID=2676123 RepID=A0A496PG53_9MICC|nr:hypothetical protein DWQ67_13440 [Galactobacter caseinivorans]
MIWLRVLLFIVVHTLGLFVAQLALPSVWFSLSQALSPDGSNIGPTLFGLFWSVGNLMPLFLASLLAWLVPYRLNLRVPGERVHGGRYVALALIGAVAVFACLLALPTGARRWDESGAVLTMLGDQSLGWLVAFINGLGTAVAVFAVLWPALRRRMGPWAAGACAALTVSVAGVIFQIAATLDVLGRPTLQESASATLVPDYLGMFLRILAWVILAAGVATLGRGSAPGRTIALGALAVSGAGSAASVGGLAWSLPFPMQALLLLPSLLVGFLAWLWGRTAKPENPQAAPNGASSAGA